MRVHGGCVAMNGRGLLILGPSGSGKSSLALALMGMGAGLVSDDQTLLTRAGGGGIAGPGAVLIADAPDTIRGRIEARGVGILNAAAVGPVPVTLAVRLGEGESQRLPPLRHTRILGVALPLVLGLSGPHLAFALRQYLLAGRSD